MRISTTSRFLMSITACTLVSLLAVSAASAASFQGSDRLVRNHRIVGRVASVLIQDNTTSVAVDAQVSDFTAPTVPATYRARLAVNLTCADRGSEVTDADHPSHVHHFQFRGAWRANKVDATRKHLLAEPLFTKCPAGQVIELYEVRFQAIDPRGSLVGLAFVAPSTPLL
ncbi:MAG: hypothetical protein JWL76_928 [Thermoleophilia bacterium]|nr:hypothetical protein [Thermoleophilia bacterium]